MQEYIVVIDGLEHTFQYSEEDAKRLGLKAPRAKAADAPANKARKSVANKAKG